MDKAIEDEINNCIACQSTGRLTPPAKIQPSLLPNEVWDTLNVDFLGPLPNGKYVFAIMDQRSRFPFAAVTASTSAKNIIKVFHVIFGQYGYPRKIISDNGPPFKLKEIKDYFSKHAIIHYQITPYWPQANRENECFMKPMMKVIQSAYIEQNDWENALQEFLFSYRVTPHSSTQILPADLMYYVVLPTLYQIYPMKSTLTSCKGLYSGMIVLQSGSTIQQENVNQRKVC